MHAGHGHAGQGARRRPADRRDRRHRGGHVGRRGRHASTRSAPTTATRSAWPPRARTCSRCSRPTPTRTSTTSTSRILAGCEARDRASTTCRATPSASAPRAASRSRRRRSSTTRRSRPTRTPTLAELAWLFNMNRGIFMTPGREEEWTLSVTHTDEAVDALRRGLRGDGRGADRVAHAFPMPRGRATEQSAPSARTSRVNVDFAVLPRRVPASRQTALAWGDPCAWSSATTSGSQVETVDCVESGGGLAPPVQTGARVLSAASACTARTTTVAPPRRRRSRVRARSRSSTSSRATPPLIQTPAGQVITIDGGDNAALRPLPRQAASAAPRPSAGREIDAMVVTARRRRPLRRACRRSCASETNTATRTSGSSCIRQRVFHNGAGQAARRRCRGSAASARRLKVGDDT